MTYKVYKLYKCKYTIYNTSIMYLNIIQYTCNKFTTIIF